MSLSSIYRAIAIAMRPIQRRVSAMIVRGVIDSIDDDSKLQAVKFQATRGETSENAEHFQPYGLTSKAFSESEAIILNLGGHREHPIIIAVADRRYRLTGLDAGEVALYDDLGQKVHLTRDGIVIESAKAVDVDCKDATITASGGVTLDNSNIKLGATAAKALMQEDLITAISTVLGTGTANLTTGVVTFAGLGAFNLAAEAAKSTTTATE